MNITYRFEFEKQEYKFFSFTTNNNMDENKISEICTCDPNEPLLNPCLVLFFNEYKFLTNK